MPVKTFSQVPGDEQTRIISCPVCAAPAEIKRVWNCDSYGFSRCPCCGSFYQNPQPLFDDLKERYDQDYAQYEVDRGSDFLQLMILSLEDVGFSWGEGAQGKTFLDVGCATGLLVKEARDKGFSAMGVELCAQAAQYGRDHYGVDIRTGTLEQASLPSASVDFFHASHLIEHLNEPALFLREVFRLLKPGGRAILTTPNAAGFQAKLMGPHWRSAIADHMVLFTLTSFRSLLQQEGFTVEKWKTWGGLPAGVRPRWLKKPLDKAAKAWGWGDVMVLSAVKKTT